ncbi:Hypothetical predicted protein [Paramuricea clavata]|uniref:Uncharacterized protein n=1 Tax=Paramuricea clavata TaxID=317549 RepID=A0A7D9I5W3_PARCT|nr:Hypothetical predicted protein [Paramuricea clavata]
MPVNEETPSLDNLCQKFNNAFVNISSNFSPLDHCPNSPSIHVPDELLVSSNEVFCDLSHIKSRSAIGPDGIPNRVLKDFAFELAPVLAVIYNSSMKQGIFPEQLKASIAIPLPKCHPPKEINSDLRPISLTNQVAKIMEGFTLKRLSDDLLPMLDQFQFAGFDLVDHSVLLSELNCFGVNPVLQNWVSAFLYKRSQCVRIGSSNSEYRYLIGGIPQGMKLGPLLFAVLVNSLINSWHYRVKFVDDLTSLEIIPRNSPSLTPFLVNEVNQYASTRHMRLNPKKCKEMRICFLKYRSPIGGQLLIGGHQVDLVKHFKLLGVYMSDDLSWNKHVGYITKKGFKRLYILRQLKIAGISDKDLALIYISLIRSVLEYAAPVWASYRSTYLMISNPFNEGH